MQSITTVTSGWISYSLRETYINEFQIIFPFQFPKNWIISLIPIVLLSECAWELLQNKESFLLLMMQMLEKMVFNFISFGK